VSDRTVIVATFNRRHEADMARGYLEDAGVPAVSTADDGGGAFGVPLTFSQGGFATVRVLQENAHAARRLLREGGFLPEDEEDEEGEGSRGGGGRWGSGEGEG
jgi:hypothetical protein